MRSSRNVAGAQWSRWWLPSAAGIVPALLATGAGCSVDNARVPFTTYGRLDMSRSCTSAALSALNPARVRLSIRVRDAAGKVALDGNGKPVVCDALLDATAGKVEAVPPVPPGGKAEFFIEAFDAVNHRIASGALLGVDATQKTFPSVRLLGAEKWSCIPPTATSLDDGLGKRLRLFQQRAFHTATLLPNGQVLFLGGVTTTASGDAAVAGNPEAAEGYFITGAVEVYDSATQNAVRITDAAPVPRAFHHASLLSVTADGKYRILVEGGLAPKSAGVAVLSGAGGALAMAPSSFRFQISGTNSAVAASEVITYDPATSTVTHAPAPALKTYDAAFSGAAEMAGGGLVGVGGLQLDTGTPTPVPSFHITVDPTLPRGTTLSSPRAGAGVVAVPDASGVTRAALVIGGVNDPTQPPVPFERLDLTMIATLPLRPTAGNTFPNYYFPTATLLDPGASEPRILVSAGLEAQQTGKALEPPPVSVQIVRYRASATPSGLDVPTTALTGLSVQSQCSIPSTYKAVAWNAATLLASPDGVLGGDRVLLSGGTPNTTCNECLDVGSGSHTCAVAQSVVATFGPGDVNGAVSLATTENLQVPRFGHTQTILPDHTVLVAGGLTRRGNQTYGAVEFELWNPARQVAAAAGAIVDADDPLRPELAALGLVRAPGEVAAGSAIACKVPTK